MLKASLLTDDVIRWGRYNGMYTLNDNVDFWHH